MITEIEGVGFQGYDDFMISLSPGVNVIVGPSDTGKSSILRLLTWIFKNRPRGDGFRNTRLKKKDSVIGSVGFDNGEWVSREKGTKNQYTISTFNDPLKALRTDVPTEVSEITKIKDVNLQSQHPSEQYFMLTESPGQVAKLFNKVAGLTIMDDALKEINTSVRANKAECDSINKRIEKKTEQVENLNWVIEAQEMIDDLLEKEYKLEEKINKFNTIDSILVSYYSTLDDLYKKYNNLPKALNEIEVLQERNDTLHKNKADYDSWYLLRSSIKLTLSQLESTETLEKAKNEFLTLSSKDNHIEQLINKMYKIERIIKDINLLSKYIERTEDEIKDYQKEWNSYAGEECPLCGGKL